MLNYQNAAFYKKFFCVSFLVCCCILILFYKDNNMKIKYSIFFTTEQVLNFTDSGYLVSSAKCKIPDVNPFNLQAKQFYHPEKYTACRKLELLTYITKSDNIPTLHIDEDIIPSYSNKGVFCCYSNISRKVKKNYPDDSINISKCIPFENNVTLASTEEIILVKCKNDAKSKKLVYENTHLVITVKEEFEKRNNDDNNILSLLLVGIDSISRLNFIRSLPNTFEFIERNGWLPLKGYNKMDDNTFPNLMAILTGYNQSYAYSNCDPKKINKLDNCAILWKDFRKLGYVTSYGEDEVWINTFNYRKKGFTKQPTDYYLRPYMMASERLKTVKKDDMTYCAGPETSGERILNAAKDFVLTYKNYPSFGFYWMNTFSHNKINSPTGMDNKIKGFLEDLTNSGILNNTIVIFLSDHGIRFGEIRYTATGWLEERLPFIYFSFPNWFKTSFAKEYNNFLANINKLTTPYDLHLTLQHIMKISGNNNYTIRPSKACPKCVSLFEQIDLQRSCEDAAIEQHWCTCAGYTTINRKNVTVLKATDYILTQIHAIIIQKKNKSDLKCAKYNLHKIISSSISEAFDYKNDIYLLIVFETKPKAVFEATLLLHDNSFNNNNNNQELFSLVGGISRLDYYNSHSRCIDDPYLKKYCYCR